MSNWIRNSTKRRRVGPPKPHSQHTRVFNAQGVVSHASNMETKRMKQIDFDLKHAQDASERVETFQQLKSDTRSLENEESARTRDQLPSKKEQPSKALAALDRLQREDPAARRARILQCADLVGLNTGLTRKPEKPLLQVPPTQPRLHESREITDRTVDDTLAPIGAFETVPCQDLPARRTLSSVNRRTGSESESLAQETTESVDSPAKVPAFAHVFTPTSQQLIHATPFSQDEILSMGLPSSQSQIGDGSYERGGASFSDSHERVTSTTVSHSSFPFDDNDNTSMAENEYTGQSDYLRTTPQVEYGGWDEEQHSDREDIYQQPADIPPLYPIIYGRLGFPIVDRPRPLEYRLRLSGDRSGVGWPLKRWRGDETDLLADETIDIGVVPELDGLSSPTLWEETTTKPRGPYSRCSSTTDYSSSSYRFCAPREPDTTISAAATTIGSPNRAFEEEYVQGEDVVPLEYQLPDDDGAILCGDICEGAVEEIRYSPQGKNVTLNYQEASRITDAYPVQCSELAFDCSPEPTEAVIFETKPGGMEMADAMETEQAIHEDENGSEAQIMSTQQPVRGFVLAPDIFGD